ncbi:MAG TPA: nitroreductase family protein [Candidatus Bathyarchaeota archaeon]|nr:nitroreductase family protein [Candidatus Bathyarchaeota archaeon]
MDVFKAIFGRRSIRKYLDKPVEEDKLIKCLQAAIWAPSAHNSQHWNFIVVKNAETRRKLAEIHRWGRFMAEAPVVIAVVGNPSKSSFWREDLGAAVQNMLLAAYAQGLGTCWMGVADTPYEEPIKNLLNIPGNLRVLCTVALGYPAESPSRSREPLNRKVHWEKYGMQREDLSKSNSLSEC